MAALRFEGILDGIAPRQLEFVKEVLQKQGYVEGTIKVSTVGKPGQNYSIDSLKRFTIEKNGQTFRMVAKVAPTDEQKRNVICIDKIFANEHLMFNEVLPAFTELEQAAGIPEGDKFKYAKCLGSLTEQPFEIILLEDLEVDCFSTVPKDQPLPEDCVKMVLKRFAALHAASFTLKYRDPIKYNYFVNKLFNPYENFDKFQQIKAYFELVEVDCLEIIKEEKYRKTLKGIFAAFVDLIDSIKTDDNKYNIIVHGDAWTNNVMFQQKGGRFTDCYLVDYQVSRMVSPVVDSNFMIFTGTDYDMRKKHFFEWIDYYHSQLKYYLSYYDMKVELVYPREQLDKDLKRYAKMALFMGILVSSVVVRDDKDADKFKAINQEEASKDTFEANKVSHMSATTIAKFKVRTEGLIDSCYELGLINE